MPSTLSSKTITISVLLGMVALFAGLFVFQHLHAKPEIDPNSFHGTYLKNPRPISDFQLLGSDGQPFDNAHLTGQWTMVFFGFTNCGYVCPVTMAELAKAYRLMGEKGIHPMPQVVMVTLDPERDDLDKLTHYAHSFDAHFFGARGNPDVIKKMTQELGVVYTKVASKQTLNRDNYDIQHSGAIIIFNPKGQLNAFLTPPHHAKDIAEDLRKLVG